MFSRFSKKSKHLESKYKKKESGQENHVAHKLSAGHMAVISKELSADNVPEIVDENEPKEDVFNFHAYVIGA